MHFLPGMPIVVAAAPARAYVAPYYAAWYRPAPVFPVAMPRSSPAAVEELMRRVQPPAPITHVGVALPMTAPPITAFAPPRAIAPPTPPTPVPVPLNQQW